MKLLREIDLSRQGGFKGRYRIYKARWVAEAPNMISLRKLYCWLFDKQNLVGSFKIYEFDADLMDDDQFCYLMDAESNSVMELAENLTFFWPEIFDSIFVHGKLVYADYLAVDPKHARHGEWAAIMRRIIEIEFPDRALLALKAFPIDYDTIDHTRGLEIRQRALMRLYRRAMGVRPFPGQAGEMGWMYAIGPRFIEDIPIATP
ncbi:hypothetical protein OCUBac02_08100 [Bosea sp. ANAM02]|nr:hypothetical protein OCUBac02_08100 [Bosea sp. ANAM02]